MSLPRRVVAGDAYMLTRRCARREFRLTPADPAVAAVVPYCLAYAASKYDVEVFCFSVMSNHYHLGVRDPKGNLPRFAGLFNSLVARALNAAQDEGEALWSSTAFSAVRLGDAEAVLDKLAYMICNPCDADLVDRPEDWPGLIATVDDLCQRELVAVRPRFFFRRPGDDEDGDGADRPETAARRARRRRGSGPALPDVVRLKLSRPPGFDDLSDDELRALVAERVELRLAEARARRAREGREVLGAAAVLLQGHRDTPGSARPGFGLNPRLACRDRWRRAQLLAEQVAFWRDHAEARDRFRAGERGVVFPAGTYWYRVHFGARCRAAPPALAA